MKKNILILGATLALMAFNANAVVTASGTDGSVTWSVEDGVLTISGSGNMKDYEKKSDGTGSKAPWYNYKDEITSINVTDISTIGKRAFRGLENVQSVNIASSVTTIKDTAFEGNSSLTSISIPDTVTSLGQWVFKENTSLKTVEIGSGVTQINTEDFYGATSLTSLTIGNNVTSIGNSAFYGATSLKTLVIPDSVTSLGEGAFKNASNLQYLTIGDGLTEISVHAFENATGLKKLKIPQSVTKIQEGAFSHAESLTTIDFGGVTEIGTKSFAYAFSLESLVIPGTVTKIGNRTFVNSTSLKELVIGDGVTSLGERAFSIDDTYNPDPVNNPYKSVLEKVTIGKNLTSIEQGCFSGAPIKELTFDPENTHLDTILGFFFNPKNGFDIGKINCTGSASACNKALDDAGFGNLKAILGDVNVEKPAPTTLTAADVQPPAQQEPSTEELQGDSGDELPNNEDQGSDEVPSTPGDQASTEPQVVTNPSAGFNRNTVRASNKIYTVHEANLAAGRKNRVMLRYR